MKSMKRSIALFFSQQDLQLARDNVERAPVKDAMAVLDDLPEDRLESAQFLALSYLFRRDEAAGDAAIDALQAQDFVSADLPSLKRQLGWLSAIAMLREHPRWNPIAEEGLSAIANGMTGNMQSGDPLLLSWLAAVTMATGILTDDDKNFLRVADAYRLLIDSRIHPEGYIKGLVDRDGASNTYAAQFSATCALVLMAEMAGQVGLDLWSYNNRAVSANTAATYTYYYYFFPERWKWEHSLTRESTVDLMRREGAYFEMVNRRSPMRGVEQLFAEQRPMFSVHGGGLTTLTHGLAPPRKRRWGLF